MSSADVTLAHDRVDEALSLLDSTSGRDNVLRLAFWMCKYLKAKSQSEEKKTQLYGNLANQLDLTMKVLRFGRNVAVLRAIVRTIQSSSSPSSSSALSSELVLGVLAKLFVLSSLTCDNLLFAGKMGIWQTNSDTLSTVGSACAGSWLGEICCTIALQLVRLHELSAQDGVATSVTTAVVSAGSAVVTTSSSSALLAAQRGMALRTLLRAATLDLPVALSSLGFLNEVPEHHFSALGALSALSAIFEQWPSVYVAKSV